MAAKRMFGRAYLEEKRKNDMKIAVQDVQVGKLFVKDWTVREITADFGYEVRYRSYDLNSGAPVPDRPGLCSREHITRWAQRECTPKEAARMQREKGREAEEETVEQNIRSFLSKVPDHLLAAEARRRGLKL